jgi:hypothetical protein
MLGGAAVDVGYAICYMRVRILINIAGRLMDEDIVRGKMDPQKEEDLKRFQDTIRRALRGKYHVAYERLSEADPKFTGKMSIDEFVSRLITMLPTGTEAKKLRRIARSFDKDKKGMIDYWDFCDEFASKDSKHEKKEKKGGSRSKYSDSDDDLSPRSVYTHTHTHTHTHTQAQTHTHIPIY